MSIPDKTLTNINRHVELAVGIHDAYARIGLKTEPNELENQIKQIVQTHLKPLEDVRKEEAEFTSKKIQLSNRNIKLLFACLSFASLAVLLKCRVMMCVVMICALYIGLITENFI